MNELPFLNTSPTVAGNIANIRGRDDLQDVSSWCNTGPGSIMSSCMSRLTSLQLYPEKVELRRRRWFSSGGSKPEIPEVGRRRTGSGSSCIPVGWIAVDVACGRLLLMAASIDTDDALPIVGLAVSGLDDESIVVRMEAPG
jgi:hypothetical protein